MIEPAPRSDRHRLSNLQHSLRHRNTWDDVALPEVRLKDLDRVATDWFRKRAAASGPVTSAVFGSADESLVEDLHLREGPYLTRAAALLFHRAPQRLFPRACLKIRSFRGSELLFQDVIEGNLFAQVDRAVDLLETKYTRALVSYEGVHRVETFPVPREAIREAVINAIIHRDYASPTVIQIRVSDDRISIWNAAVLSPEWFAEHLAEELASRPHNPRIAGAFFRAGMIDAWGLGIRRIVDLCGEAGIPAPRWRLDPGGEGLRVCFRFSAAYRAADADARGSQERGTTVADPRSTPITTQDRRATTPKPTVERLLDCLRADPTLTRRALADSIGVTPDGVKYHLKNLKASGALRRVGSPRSGHWEVLR